MDESKRQPEEHEVLAEIHSVISNNPDFGTKRVANSIKSNNPDWHIGDKRVSKIYKKYKSSMSSEDTGSSPWNVAPAAPSPEAASPWAVSPFQTSNPFKSPESPPTPSETEPEPDVVSSAVMEDLPAKEETSAFSTAFEPAAEEAPAASSAWTSAPVAEETAQPSAWTSAASEAVEKVQEAVEEVVQQTPESVVKEETVVEKEVEPEVPQVEETASSAWTSAPAQEEPSASAWTAAPVQEEVSPVKVEEEVEKAPVKETEVVEEPIHVEEVAAPVEEHVEEAPAAVVEEVAEEVPVVTSSAWTTAPVHKETSSTWTTAPVQEEAAKDVVEDVAEVGPADAKQFAEEAGVAVAEPVVEAVQVEDEVELISASSPWTSAPTQEEVKEIAEVVKEVEPVEETPAPVVEEVISTPVEIEEEQVPAPIIDSPVEEEPVTASAWNTTPTQEEVAVKKVAEIPAVVEPIVETPKPVVETHEPVAASPVEEEVTTSAWNTQPLQNAAPVVESVKEEVVAAVEEVAAPVVEAAAVVKTKVEEEAPAASSAWNTTPVQKEAKTVVVEKVVEPVKEVAAEPVQEPVAIEKKVEVMETLSKEVVVATETVVEDAPLDKKAIANAFDGVDSYKVDSVVKVKKVPNVEAAAAKSADAPGACGACGIACRPGCGDCSSAAYSPIFCSFGNSPWTSTRLRSFTLSKQCRTRRGTLPLCLARSPLTPPHAPKPAAHTQHTTQHVKKEEHVVWNAAPKPNATTTEKVKDKTRHAVEDAKDIAAKVTSTVEGYKNDSVAKVKKIKEERKVAKEEKKAEKKKEKKAEESAGACGLCGCTVM
ncbi:Zonadhesin [Phytophthora citrophthora]|uniref:Zonadhesin n=1 Tax=Phytophthora citrophthora TaxID=4793 RepID=A0AAD9G6C0_9STRA|nr:Zonadhesin [Phytophthora citrophthora]